MTGSEIVRKGLENQLYKSAYSRSLFTLYGITIKEIRVSFRQFYTWKFPITSFFRVIGIIMSALNRLLLGRNLKYSFAFTGEDRILESVFKPLVTYNGFYVDVGCNHPVFYSNTYAFYRKGWRGICIDANSKLIEKYKRYRPKDKAVSALVSDSDQVRSFYLIQNNVLSTTHKENLQLAETEGLSYKEIQCTPRSLTSILNECNSPKEIDILSIDAEEHDFNVLNSLDFSKYSPKLIIVEDESFDIKSFEKNVFYDFMLQKNYKLVGFILKNLYFIRTKIN